MPLHVSSTIVLIIRRSKFYYTASGIITLRRWPSGAQVERGLLSTCAPYGHLQSVMIEQKWNVMAHGNARVEK